MVHRAPVGSPQLFPNECVLSAVAKKHGVSLLFVIVYEFQCRENAKPMSSLAVCSSRRCIQTRHPARTGVDMLAQLFGPQMASRHMRIVELPGSANGENKMIRDDIGLFCRDFAVDPTQDLMVMVEFCEE